MVIVDTTVWVDYLRGTRTPEAEWLDSRMPHQRLGLTDLIFCEVLQGIGNESTFTQVRRELLGFEVFPTGGVEFATAAARNFRTLRRRGITIRRTIDCWIATFCLLQGHMLLHHDRDFDSFERHLGLSVVHA